MLQNLATVSPQLSSILSTPKVQSALASASPGDLVELSNEALQLQQTSVLFGTADGTQSIGPTSTSDSLISALSSGASGSDSESGLIVQAMENATTLAGTATPTDSNSQAQEFEALLGTAVDQ
jgi:hypothetical protein